MLTFLYFLDLNHFNVHSVMMEVNGFSLSVSWWLEAIHNKKMDDKKDRLKQPFLWQAGNNNSWE